METFPAARAARAERARRRHLRAETIETAMIVALAGLVALKGAPVTIGIALGIGQMFTDLMRVLTGA